MQNTEVTDAIAIAAKHLRGGSVELRKALALDIFEAITRHSSSMAKQAIDSAIRPAPPQDVERFVVLDGPLNIFPSSIGVAEKEKAIKLASRAARDPAGKWRFAAATEKEDFIQAAVSYFETLELMRKA